MTKIKIYYFIWTKNIFNKIFKCQMARPTFFSFLVNQSCIFNTPLRYFNIWASMYVSPINSSYLQQCFFQSLKKMCINYLCQDKKKLLLPKTCQNWPSLTGWPGWAERHNHRSKIDWAILAQPDGPNFLCFYGVLVFFLCKRCGLGRPVCFRPD